MLFNPQTISNQSRQGHHSAMLCRSCLSFGSYSPMPSYYQNSQLQANSLSEFSWPLFWNRTPCYNNQCRCYTRDSVNINIVYYNAWNNLPDIAQPISLKKQLRVETSSNTLNSMSGLKNSTQPVFSRNSESDSNLPIENYGRNNLISPQSISSEENGKVTKVGPFLHLNVSPSMPIARLAFVNDLFRYLSKLLRNEAIDTNDAQLSQTEKHIMFSFLERKIKVARGQIVESFGCSIEKLRPSDLVEFARTINACPSTRRREEKIKMIFNWIFNTLKKAIEQDATNQSEDYQAAFNEKYFKETAESNRIDISQFCRPTFSRVLTIEPKTFNARFIKNLKLSKSFINDAQRVLKEEFETSILFSIRKKTFRQCKKWDQHLQKTGTSAEIIEQLCESIFRSKKSKLPWSLVEALDARAAVENLLTI